MVAVNSLINYEQATTKKLWRLSSLILLFLTQKHFLKPYQTYSPKYEILVIIARPVHRESPCWISHISLWQHETLSVTIYTACTYLVYMRGHTSIFGPTLLDFPSKANEASFWTQFRRTLYLCAQKRHAHGNDSILERATWKVKTKLWPYLWCCIFRTDLTI